MSISCALSEKQIIFLFSDVYKNLKESGDKFDHIEYMKKLFSDIKNKKDIDTAAKFLQNVPEIIGSLSFRKEFIKTRIDASAIKDIITLFTDENNGINEIKNYFEPVEKISVIKEEIIKQENDAFNIEEIDSNKIKTQDKNFLSDSVFTGTLEEFITIDPKNKSEFETIDLGKKHIFNTLSSLKKALSNISELEDFIYQNTKINLKPVKFSEIEDGLLDKTTKTLFDKARAIFQRNTNLENVTPFDQLYLLVISDNDGNYIYFDNDGNITTKELGGKIVYQFLRDVKFDKEKNRYRVTDIYDKNNQILSPEMIAETQSITIEEADSLQQMKFKELYDLREKFNESSNLILLNIVGISEGIAAEKPLYLGLNNISEILKDNDNAIRTLNTISEDTSEFKKGSALIQIKEKFYVINRPNITLEIANKIASVLLNKNIKNKKKYEFFTQFLYDNAAPSTKKHKILYLEGSDTLKFSYSETTYSEGYGTFIFVDLKDELQYQTIVNALMFASGTKGKYYSASMTFNNELIAVNEYEDYDTNNNKFFEDKSDYIEFLKKLPNTKIDINLEFKNKKFNSSIIFDPNIIKNEEIEDDPYKNIDDTLFQSISDEEDTKPIYNVTETKNNLIKLLKDNQKITGTISKPTNSKTKWIMKTPDGIEIEFYNVNNNITLEESKQEVYLNYVSEIVTENKIFTDVIEVKIGDKVLGNVRTSTESDFKKQNDNKSIEDINNEINNYVNQPSPHSNTDTPPIEFFRKGDFSDNVTVQQINNAKKWWDKSPLSKYIDFNPALMLVNSDAFARFMVYGSVLNGNFGDIKISKKGSMVDIYHEAWHGFSQLFLTKEQKLSLYKEVQKKLGSKASFFEIEEMLAEDFRNYAINPKAVSSTPIRNSIFRKILNFIKQLFGKGFVTNVLEIQTVKDYFENLYLGKNLNIYIPSIDNVMFDMLERNNGVIKLNTSDQLALNKQDADILSKSMDSIISDIVNEQINIRQDKSATLGLLLDKRNRDPLYKSIKEKLVLKLNLNKKQLSETEDTEENEYKTDILKNRIRILSQGIENYGNDKEGVIKYHISNSQYDLMKQKYNSAELNEDGELILNFDATNTERFGDKKDVGKSVIQLAGKETLYILKSLHQSKFKTDSNDIIYEFDELGFKKLADFQLIWNNLTRLIGGIQDPQEMYNKLVEESKTNSQIKDLVNKLADPSISKDTSTIGNIMNEFKAFTSFWQDFSKSKIPYIQLTIFKTKIGEKIKELPDGEEKKIPVYDYKPVVFNISGDVSKIIKKFQNNFLSGKNNKYIDKIGKEKIVTLNLKKIIDEFMINEKLNTKKGYEFIKALGFNLDELNIITNKLNNVSNIDEYGLPFIFDIVKRFYILETENSTDPKKIKFLNDFKTNPIEVLSNNIPVGVIGKDIENQRTQVKALAKLQANFGFEKSMNMVLNAERNMVSEIIDNHSISKQINALNSVEKLSDLWTTDKFQYMKYLDPRINPYTKSLGTIRSLFEMNNANKVKRKNSSLLLFQNSGTQIEDSDDGMNTTNLDKNAKFLQEMHTMLKDGMQEFMRHAAKSASFGAKMESNIIGLSGKGKSDSQLWVDLDLFADGTANNYAFKAHMLPYLKAEAQRIYMFKKNKETFKKYSGYNKILSNGKYAGEVFTAFDNVLTISTKKEIYNLIDDAINKNELFELNDIDLISKIEKNVKDYFLEETLKNTEFLKNTNYIDKDLSKKLFDLGVSKENGNNLLVSAYTYNSWIQNFEMAILFYGDIAQYNHEKEELHKRNPGSTSNGRSFRTDLAARRFVNYGLLETSYAKKNNKRTIIYDGTFNTAVFEDMERDSIYYEQIEKGLRKDYERRFKEAGIENNKKEIDRRVKIESDKYLKMNEADGQGYITFDAYRTLKYLENDWSADQELLFQKISNGVEINQSDILDFFPAYKLQNFGFLANTELPVTAMHKFSLFPLIPSVISNSDLESLHEQMMDKNIQYVTFESGSKVGTITSEKNNEGEYTFDKLYDEDKKTIKNKLNFTENKIYIEYLKNVTNVPKNYKDKTVFATQLRKLILSNLYKDGDIINTKNTVAIKNYENSVDNYSAILKLELLNEIGYEQDPVTKKYKGNLKNFLDVVQRELERKDIPEHLIEFVGLNKDNTIKTDLSLHLMADEIESILVNLIEKRLVRQKVKGEALVQVASTLTNGLWDRGFKKGTQKDILKYMGSNTLPFYNNDTNNGYTLPMKVAIAMQGDFFNLLKRDDIAVYTLQNINGELKKTLDTKSSISKLNQLIKDDAWMEKNKKLVTLSAVRIPVQGLNSMEFMEVYEFLDPSAGNIIIPPSEIVIKSGTDYDIDKLTTFMPNIDNLGNYVNSKISNEEFISKILNINKSKVGNKEVSNLIKIQKASIENQLISSINGILELPENYANLVKPNDTYLLKDDIADKIENDVTDYDRFKNNHREPNITNNLGQNIISPTRVFEIGYNLHKHDVNIVAKKVLGLIAVENSLHPVFNQIGMSLPKTYKNLKFNKKLNKFEDTNINNIYRLLLPHNKTKDGNISLSGVNSIDGVDNIGEIFSQMMNGAVDVEKNPWIFFIQGNYEVIPMLTFLIKAGVPREYAVYFVSNPLVRKYVKEQQEIKSAYSKITKKVDEDHLDSYSKYIAANNVLNSIGSKYSVSQKNYYKSAVNATKGIDVFDLEQMKNLVENPNSKELENLSIAMFLHFIELEKSTRGFTSLKFISNPDTKTSKTLNEIIRRNLSVEEARELSSLNEGTVDKILDSVLGSFFDNSLISDLIQPLFSLTNNNTVTDFISDKLQKNFNDIKKFGKGIDGTRRFIKEYKKAIPNYIFQNHMSNFVDSSGNIVSIPDEYKEYSVKEKKNVKNGIEIENKIIYVDSERLRKDYNNKLYLLSNTSPLSYTSLGLKGFNPIVDLFPNDSIYIKYVFERELLRKEFPINRISNNNEFKKINETISNVNEAYETFLNRKALLRSFNRSFLMSIPNQSYTDIVLNLIDEFPVLKNKYSILSEFIKVSNENVGNILTIMQPKSLSDSKLAEIYYENILNLGNVNVKKVRNIQDNKRISEIFNILPLVMLYQHGVGYSKYGITKALPYDSFITIMQPLSEIFIKNQLNNETLNLIFEKLTQSKSYESINYLVSSKKYNEPDSSKEDDESVFISSSEASVILGQYTLGVDEDLEESELSPTQPSTSVKEGVEELFKSNTELANDVYEAAGFTPVTSKLTKKGESLLNTTFNKIENQKQIIYANYLAEGESALKNILDTIARLHIYENYRSKTRINELEKQNSPKKELQQEVEKDLKKGFTIKEIYDKKIKELKDKIKELKNILNTFETNEKNLTYFFAEILLKNNPEKEAKELIEYYENLLEKFIDGGIESFEALVEKNYSIYGDVSEEILDLLEQERLNDFSKYYRNLLNDQIIEIKENFFIGELSKKANPTDRNIFNKLTNNFIESFIAEGQESITVQFLKDLSNETSINSKTQNLVRELERRLDILKNKKNGHYLMTVLNLKQYNDKNQTVNITPQQKQQAQQLYSQYLDTIFPDSKVKDIVYHATQNKDKILEEGFDKNYLTSRTGISNKFWDPTGELEKRNKLGFFFAKNGKSIVLSLQGFGERFSGSELKNSVLPTILNLTNPQVIDDLDTSKVKEGYDGIISTEEFHIPDNAGGIDYTDTIYVAPEPEQIHILGNKQDIEGFKEFVDEFNNNLENKTLGFNPKINISYSTDNLIIDKYFSNSRIQKASDILSKIANSNYSLNNLAKFLLKYNSINNVDIGLYSQEFIKTDTVLAAGVYYQESNTIAIAEFAKFYKGNSETVILHEILHALSYKALRKNNEFTADFKKLYESAKNQLELYDPKTRKGTYGTYDIDEFFVALFTDSEFILELQNLDPIDIKNYKNLFEEIFDYILNLLNITKGNSLYNQAFAVASNMLQEESDNTYAMDTISQEEVNFESKELIYSNVVNYNINKPKGLPGIARTSTDCQ